MTGQEPAPDAFKLVVRVIRVGGQTWRGEGRTEAEAFRKMREVTGTPEAQR